MWTPDRCLRRWRPGAFRLLMLKNNSSRSIQCGTEIHVIWKYLYFQRSLSVITTRINFEAYGQIFHQRWATQSRRVLKHNWKWHWLRRVVVHSIYLFSYCVTQRRENIQYKQYHKKKQECLLYTSTWRVDSLIHNIDKFT